MTTIKKILDWEKIFDERFNYTWIETRGNYTLEEKVKDIKSFTSSTYSHLIEEIIKMVEEMELSSEQYKNKFNTTNIAIGESIGYNSALSDIITNLSTLNE